MIASLGVLVVVAPWRRVSRQVSRAGIVASVLGLLLGLSGVLRGDLARHMYVMLYAGLFMFPHFVAIAYVGSSGKSLGVKLTGVMALASLPAIAIPVVAHWSRETGPALLMLLAAFASVPAAVASARERRGSLRLSMALAAASYLGLAGVLVTRLIWGSPGIVGLALAVALGYTVPLIIAVTVHSLPSTFGDKPDAEVSVAALLVSLSGAAAAMRGDAGLAVNLWLLGSVLYIYGARLVRVGRYFRVAREKSRGSERAYRGLWYYLVGHVFVVALVALSGAMLAYYSMEGRTGGFLALLGLHLVAAGFAWMHVAIHAPMMLPVILGVRHAMRYSVAPYVLVLLGVLAWPVSGPASLGLLLASMAAMAYVFVRVGR